MKDNHLKIIKLCKSLEPTRVLVNFFEKEYYSSAIISETHYGISVLLMEVIEKYIPFDLANIVLSLHPNKAIDSDESYDYRMMYTLMHQIRQCEVKKIKDLDLDKFRELSIEY
tara:strand:+ start:187 stop:525 length:339 start_codon:yes stop_codon:yes gene_type:complete